MMAAEGWSPAACRRVVEGRLEDNQKGFERPAVRDTAAVAATVGPAGS